MDRRTFLGLASAAILMQAHRPAAALAAPLKPMELGLKISLSADPEPTLRRVRDLGFTNCFHHSTATLANSPLSLQPKSATCLPNTRS